MPALQTKSANIYLLVSSEAMVDEKISKYSTVYLTVTQQMITKSLNVKKQLPPFPPTPPPPYMLFFSQIQGQSPTIAKVNGPNMVLEGDNGE